MNKRICRKNERFTSLVNERMCKKSRKNAKNFNDIFYELENMKREPRTLKKKKLNCVNILERGKLGEIYIIGGTDK